MSSQPIKEPEIKSIDPIALRHNQTDVVLEKRDYKKWGEVTCNNCAEKFWVGQVREQTGNTISPADTIEKFEALLAKEHADRLPHSNAYDSTWGWQRYTPKET